MADRIEIRRLGSVEIHEQLDALAGVLVDCVAGGASVSYLAPFSHADARGVFEAVAAEVERGRRLLLAAFANGDVVGTVQVILALPPNQPHRGEIASCGTTTNADRSSVRLVGRLVVAASDLGSCYRWRLGVGDRVERAGGAGCDHRACRQ